MNNQYAIETKGLTKKYGSVTALDNLNLNIPHGAIFGFLGPNGAGKTTTVRLMAGLAHPSAGSVTVAGVDATHAGLSLRQKIGLLDQHPQFYTWMTGREFLNFVGELFGLRGATLKSRVDEVLEQTGLTDAAKRKTGGYSGGMKQRLGLAQALINKPDVLFLDEPASALDPEGRYDVLKIIEGLKGKATVFMSTHILGDVERVCDQVAIVNKGRLLVESSLEELQNRFAQPIFIFEPEARQEEKVSNLIQALRLLPWVDGVGNEHGQVRVAVNDVEAAMKNILPMLARYEVAVGRFWRAVPSLEDIFLKLIGDDSGKAPTLVQEVKVQAKKAEAVK